jgi:hypothetical protein
MRTAGSARSLAITASADFAGHSGLIEMSEEETAQAAGLHFAGKVGVVDLASDAVSPGLGGSIQTFFVSIGADGCCAAFSHAARDNARGSSIGAGREGYKHARAEVSDSMFDHARVESVGGRGALAFPIAKPLPLVPFHSGAAAGPGRRDAESECIFGGVHHLKFADVERIYLGQIGAAAFFHVRQHGFQLRSLMPLRESSRRSMASDELP